MDIKETLKNKVRLFTIDENLFNLLSLRLGDPKVIFYPPDDKRYELFKDPREIFYQNLIDALKEIFKADFFPILKDEGFASKEEFDDAVNEVFKELYPELKTKVERWFKNSIFVEKELHDLAFKAWENFTYPNNPDKYGFTVTEKGVILTAKERAELKTPFDFVKLILQEKNSEKLKQAISFLAFVYYEIFPRNFLGAEKIKNKIKNETFAWENFYLNNPAP